MITIFRILPHLIFESHFEPRLIFSSIIFGLLHGIPLIKLSDKMERIETIIKIISAMEVGFILVLIESLFTLPIYWYISCCIIHGLNNIIFIYYNNKKIIYNSGTTNLGFVSKIL